jgi:hypothetical protein
MKDTKIKITIPYLTNLKLEIPANDVVELLGLLKNTDIKLATCVAPCFNVNMQTSILNVPKSPSVHSELILSGMAHIDKIKCDPRISVFNKSSYEKAQACFDNLKNGKCKDEFVRRTVGSVLFPQHYANEKQK